ncbi:hypothetical protein V8E55_011990 [Tylopilus felleus]
MFSRFTTLLSIAALVAVATAAPDVCTQDQYCCDKIFDGSIQLGGALGDTLTGTGPHAGLTCEPIVDSVPCKERTVCCTKKNIKGLDTIVCAPVDAA